MRFMGKMQSKRLMKKFAGGIGGSANPYFVAGSLFADGLCGGNDL